MTCSVSRVFRGGSCWFGARLCRSAIRDWSAPGGRDSFLGFRPVAEVKKKGKKS